jgi:hypothetical protein
MRFRTARGTVVCCLAASGLVLAAVAAGSGSPGQKLTGSGKVGASEFGNSIALSADAGTMLIGGRNDKSLIGALEGLRVHSQALGAAWVFTHSGSVWRQQGKKLTAKGERGPGGFGNSVALSADGRTALIGGPSGYGGVGAAWIFTRSGSTWRQEAELLPPGTGKTTGYVVNPTGFGASVALSGNGRIALIGGPSANGGGGAAWIFTRSGSTWKQQARLTGIGESGSGLFGTSVSLSGAGTTALVGAPLDGNGIGAIWMFARSGSTWRPVGGKLTAKHETGYARFGSAVALASSGADALVGGPVDNNGVGAAWLIVCSASSCGEAGRLTAKDEVGLGQFGDSVALSSSGTTALIGGAFDRNGVGAAWVFRRSSSGWSQRGKKLTGRGATGPFPVQFGASAVLSSRGTTAMIGAIGDADGAGSVWVFRL